MKASIKLRISQLSPEQRQRLAWLLDEKTDTDKRTADYIADGEDGDQELTEVFEGAGMTPHRAKIYARKVIDLSYLRTGPRAKELKIEIVKIAQSRFRKKNFWRGRINDWSCMKIILFC